MIDSFRPGRWYICTATERQPHWNDVGEMDFALSGNPLLCRSGSGAFADFVDFERGNEDSWAWERDFFIELPEGVQLPADVEQYIQQARIEQELNS